MRKDRKPTILGERLRRERLARKETQAQTASRFGVGQSSYYRWESGDSVPDPDRYESIGGFLGLSGGDVYALINSEHVPTTLDEVKKRIRDLQQEGLDRSAAHAALLKEFDAQRQLIEVLQADLNVLKMAVGGKPQKR